MGKSLGHAGQDKVAMGEHCCHKARRTASLYIVGAGGALSKRARRATLLPARALWKTSLPCAPACEGYSTRAQRAKIKPGSAVRLKVNHVHD